MINLWPGLLYLTKTTKTLKLTEINFTEIKCEKVRLFYFS